MMQSIQYGLKIITIVKMFKKCYENPVKIKFINMKKCESLQLLSQNK